MPLTAISRLLESELVALNETIIQSLESQVNVIEKMGQYLIESGGKRIRPLVTILSSKVCQVKGNLPITMAAIIEFIHTATLLHDDVVDGSKMRRGKLTANRVWDNPTAILVGDFLYSRSFQMMISLNSMSAMQILADATNAIAEGEVLQLTHRNQPDIDEPRYHNVIRLKTAKLFEAAALLGSCTQSHSESMKLALAQYGHHLGCAFQIVDDVLDYQADSQTLGKNLGDDLAEGKMTLPLIYALKHASPPQSEKIRQTIITGNLTDFDEVKELIVSTGAIDYTMRAARKEAAQAIDALSHLPASSYRDAMTQLADFAISRCS